MMFTFLDGFLLGFFLGAAVVLRLAARRLFPKVLDEMMERGYIVPGPTAVAEFERDECSHRR